MTKTEILKSVKEAMRAVNQANLILSYGNAIEALDGEALQLVAENAIAIKGLANSISERARQANRSIEKKMIECKLAEKEISAQDCQAIQADIAEDGETCETCQACAYYIPFVMFQMAEGRIHK